MSCIHITKEHSINFFLFRYSFKLFGSLDILILPCEVLNFKWILTLQSLVWFLILFSLEKTQRYARLPDLSMTFKFLFWFSLTFPGFPFFKITSPNLDPLCTLQSNTVPFYENYAKLYFDAKHLKKRLNSVWWNFWSTFFYNSALFGQYWILQ